ncbi:MFS transporter [Siphonobacter curvatus]|uniref:Transporter n=1 Tax=Siphonobacter curvatus TaxID=2094562 RepID=A0A2S7IRB6_9BACT|nr:MFS transporter [Siphonobacter curvatus]PQA60209.1 transporter [Siphonobacter curvatus]
METLPIFKRWVPEWFIRATLFIVLMPGLFLLGLYAGNVNETVGYYGIEPADVQFSILVYYVALASFFSLEQRLVSYFAAKHYFLLGLLLTILINLALYQVRHPQILFVLRFFQGICISGIIATSMNLIFSRMRTERVRIMGYTVFYGLLLVSAPLSSLVVSWALQYLEFNALYKLMIYMQLPGAILLLLIMNHVRLKRHIPLYQVEWISFVLMVPALLMWAYMMVYGQQENGLDSPRIWFCLLGSMALTTLFILRQRSLKRPYINLSVFKSSSFVLGLLLLLVFYVCRGALGLSSTYFATVLKMDPIHVSELMLVNMAGIAVGSLVVSRFVILKKSLRLILLTGFAFLGVFHVWMYSLFSNQAEPVYYVIPLFFQGLGAATLMVPIINFYVSAVPASISSSASAVGILVRFTGFSLSMGILNFTRLFSKSLHYHRLQDEVTATNPYTLQRLAQYRETLMHQGMAGDQASLAASKLLGQTVDLQTQLRYSMDYYLIVAAVIGVTMLAIALVPYLRTKLLFTRQPPIPF